MSTQGADFPDFFRGGQRSNLIPLISEMNVAKTNATFNYGPFNATEWDSIGIYATSTDRCVIQLLWYADAAATLLVGHQIFRARANQIVTDIVPAQGPYFTMQTIFHVGAGTATASLLITARSGVRQWPAILPGLQISAVSQETINPTATTTTPPTYVTTGRAHLAVDTLGASWVAVCTALDEGGAIIGTVGKVEHSAYGGPCETDFLLPPFPVQVAITNNDASQHTYSFALTASRTA